MSASAVSRKVTSNTKCYSQGTAADETRNVQAQYNLIVNIEIIHKTKEVPE
jgi:hypothetical protein